MEITNCSVPYVLDYSKGKSKCQGTEQIKAHRKNAPAATGTADAFFRFESELPAGGFLLAAHEICVDSGLTNQLPMGALRPHPYQSPYGGVRERISGTKKSKVEWRNRLELLIF